MSNTKIFPKGISFFPPKENAPSWVKGSLIITPRPLIEWLKENESVLVDSEKYGKQLRLQVTDKGVQVDTWKPTESKPERKTAADNIPKGVQNKEVPDVEDFSLPF
jgi:hypothetical protein